MVPIYALNNERKTKNSSMQELFRIRTIKVLRGNFAAVDLCEEPCHNGLSEKEKHGGKGKQRNGGRRRNRAILQAGQRKTSCPPPRFRLLYLFGNGLRRGSSHWVKSVD